VNTCRLPKLGERWRRIAFAGVWLDFATLYVGAVVWDDPVVTALAMVALVALAVIALLA